jgi:amidase
MAWQNESIMARKGVAKGERGEEYTITETEQGKYHYVYGPYVNPVLTVDPGAVVSAETHDAFEGAIKHETDSPSKILNFPFLNPQNGPIHVNGAEKGDVLAVYIESIVPRGPQPCGTTVVMPDFGGLVSTGQTALLNPALPERVKKLVIDAKTGTKWNDKITLPYEPFIGTIGTSPEIEAISSLVPDYYGGNMDLPDVGVGAVIYLPVNTKGALLYLGDCHAAQGDGELCGVAIEHPTVTTVQIDLIKGWTIAWPRLETKDFIMTIGSARPMEDAARIAYRELCRWMAADYGFDEIDAYMLLTQAGRVRLGNMVDPKYTLGASIKKSYLVRGRPDHVHQAQSRRRPVRADHVRERAQHCAPARTLRAGGGGRRKADRHAGNGDDRLLLVRPCRGRAFCRDGPGANHEPFRGAGAQARLLHRGRHAGGG